MNNREILAGDAPIEALLQDVRSGDGRAFTRLVQQVEPYIFSVSMKVCRDRAVAHENAQDTFVSIYRKLDQFDGASKFTTWLYTVIVNNCKMKRRRRKIDQAMVPLDGGPEYEAVPDVATNHNESPDSGLLNAELYSVLERAMERLTPSQRAVFVLRDLEQRSSEETSEKLDISISAVKSRLHRARQVLRSELEQYYRV